MQPVRPTHDVWELLRDGCAAVVSAADGTQRTERAQYKAGRSRVKVFHAGPGTASVNR